MADSVSIAVGCAVGIPCGLAVVIALIFWYRTQRRFEKEVADDIESMNDDGAISFNNLETLKQSRKQVAEDKEELEHVIAGSGSSDDAVSHDEKLGGPVANEHGPQRSRSKYTPAYRKKINSSIGTLHILKLPEDSKSTNNSSFTSLDTQQRQGNQPNMYDQIIPVLPHENASNSGLFPNSKNASEPSDAICKASSSEELIKNLQNQDYGSYPRRKSSSTLNNLASTNQSSSSFHTRASSSHSIPKQSTENVFDTPISQKALRVDAEEEYDSNLALKKSEPYKLKNNYDMGNNEEIEEEDQYENEFTNYSENKREFIASLRPKKL